MGAKFYVDKLAPLVGGIIIGAVADPEKGFFGLRIKTPDGKTHRLWFLNDDEGNGPGSFNLEEG